MSHLFLSDEFLNFTRIGVHRDNRFYLDTNGNGTWDNVAGGDDVFTFGKPGDEPIVGDWDGDGFDDIGVHRGNRFYLDTNGNGVWDFVAGGDDLFHFGKTSGDEAIIGDWSGDGLDKIGVHRGNRFYLDTNGNGVWDYVAGGDDLYHFGKTSGDEAIIGDWSGDGQDDIGVHRGNRFYLDTNGNGVWDHVVGGDELYHFGKTSGDEAIIGDWSGDGQDKIGVQRGNRFYLDTNGNGAWDDVGGGDNLYHFGKTTGDNGIAGTWKPAAAPPMPAAADAIVARDRSTSMTVPPMDLLAALMDELDHDSDALFETLANGKPRRLKPVAS